LISKVSSWLGAPARKTKMQNSAPPRGVMFSFASTLNGRAIGNRYKPDTVAVPARKK